MHTMKVETHEHGTVLVHRNADWSGDAIVFWCEKNNPDEPRKVSLPAEVFVKIARYWSGVLLALTLCACSSGGTSASPVAERFCSHVEECNGTISHDECTYEVSKEPPACYECLSTQSCETWGSHPPCELCGECCE